MPKVRRSGWNDHGTATNGDLQPHYLAISAVHQRPDPGLQAIGSPSRPANGPGFTARTLTVAGCTASAVGRESDDSPERLHVGDGVDRASRRHYPSRDGSVRRSADTAVRRCIGWSMDGAPACGRPE